MMRRLPQKASLLELLDSPTVNEYLSNDTDIVNSLHYIRILGSSAKQGLSVKKTESELAAKILNISMTIASGKNKTYREAT